MSLSIELNGPGIERLLQFCRDPINKTEKFFKNLAGYFQDQTALTFRMEGARSGHSRWSELRLSTIMSRVGTRKIRYGTDMKPRRTREDLAEYRSEIGWGWGRTGFMPGYGAIRRYDTDSKILQASGSFMKSFRTMWVDRTGMVFGSNYHSKNGNVGAAEIAGKREVLFITPMDKSFIKTYFGQFWNEAMGRA